MNSRGQVVGSAYVTFPTSGHAFLYDNGSFTDLNSILGSPRQSNATGINDSSQIVGTTGTSNFLYSQGTVAWLPIIYGSPIAIDNNGRVLLTSGYLYDNGTVTRIGSSTPYSATAFNSNAQVTGYATIDGTSHAVLCSGGTLTDLGVPSGYILSNGFDINSSGQVVGNAATSTNSDGIQHAFLFDHGSMTDLGTLPGGSGSAAESINSIGQIVGWSYIPGVQRNSAAFLYSNGSMRNLNDLIDPSLNIGLQMAIAINDSGQIVCTGFNALAQHFLSPHPRPRTFHTLPARHRCNRRFRLRMATPPRLVLRVQDHGINPLRHAVGCPGLREAGHYPRPNRFWRPAGVAIGDSQNRLGGGPLFCRRHDQRAHRVATDIALLPESKWCLGRSAACRRPVARFVNNDKSRKKIGRNRANRRPAEIGRGDAAGIAPVASQREPRRSAETQKTRR